MATYTHKLQGQDPGHSYINPDTPLNGRETLGAPHSHNRGIDGVGGADLDTNSGCSLNHGGSGGLSRKTMDWP